MPTQVIFDMTEPDTQTMIDGWADNTEYTVTVRLKTGAGENRNVAQALEVIDESESIPEEEAEVEEAPAYAPKSAAPAPTK